jgi:hypothetical protein
MPEPEKKNLKKVRKAVKKKGPVRRTKPAQAQSDGEHPKG